jgi:RND family efflux transporter MFP subunit
MPRGGIQSDHEDCEMNEKAMKATTLTEPPASERRRGRGLPVGAVVAGALMLGMAVWIAVRIGAAVHTKGELAAEGQKAVARASAEVGAARLVEVVSPQAATWRPAVVLDASFAPFAEADLGFKTSGRLALLRAHVGDRVRAGVVVAALSDSEAAAQARAAAAQVKAGEAQLALAEDAEKRTGQLVDARATSEATGVQASGQRALAAAQLESARAQLELARATLANHTLLAPFGGTITRAPAGVGAIVTPGAPLFHISDTGRLKLLGTIAEADAPLVAVGDPVEVRVDDGRLVSGRISARLPAVDPATRRVPVEAVVDNNAEPALLAGAFVHAVIRPEQPARGVRIAATALRPGSQDEVMVVVDGRLSARRIDFVMDPAEKTGVLLVRRGLSVTERVVVDPPADASDGQPVRVAGAGPAVAR